jgi:hypothetical protein
MKRLVFVLVPFALFGLATARADDARSRSIAPFLDNDIFAIGRLDLAKVDVDKLVHRLVAEQEQAGEMSQTIAPWFAALLKAGAKEIYLLGILPEVLSTSTSPFPVIVPLGEGADAKAIGQLLCGGGTVKGQSPCRPARRSTMPSSPAPTRLSSGSASSSRWNVPSLRRRSRLWATRAPSSSCPPAPTRAGWSRRCCRSCPRSWAAARSPVSLVVCSEPQPV